MELCAASTEDDELLESDVQDLRFRFLSDSILTAVDEAPEEKSFVSGLTQVTAPDACMGTVTFDQGVDTRDLVEPELVELKIEKISPGKRKSKYLLFPFYVYIFDRSYLQNKHPKKI